MLPQTPFSCSSRTYIRAYWVSSLLPPAMHGRNLLEHVRRSFHMASEPCQLITAFYRPQVYA